MMNICLNCLLNHHEIIVFESLNEDQHLTYTFLLGFTFHLKKATLHYLLPTLLRGAGPIIANDIPAM